MRNVRKTGKINFKVLHYGETKIISSSRIKTTGCSRSGSRNLFKIKFSNSINRQYNIKELG